MSSDPHEQAASMFERLAGLTFSESRLRTLSTVEPARTMRADGFEWEHEIRVALPLSYAHTDKTYPVLWVTDNGLESALAVLDGLAATGHVPELILVSVGADRALPLSEWRSRRDYDFTPVEDVFFDGFFDRPAGDQLRVRYDAEARGGGAGRFLDFLVDQVRPALASEYRMDPDDHGLFGGSRAGLFVGYALFARPGAFARYVCGSPTLNGGNHTVFELEERYAAEHADLPAHVFFGAGDGEIAEYAHWGVVSSMVRLAETLTTRSYPSLRMTVKIFPGESHATMGPHLFQWGVRSVWADEIGPPS